MRWLYSALLYLVAPLALVRLLWRSIALRGYRERIGERFGFVAAPPGRVAAWVHAVSVGEAAAAMPLVRALLARHGPRSVWITTTTPTGSERVRAALGEDVLHSFAPYDLPGSVARFLDRVRPRQLVVMETELWPNLFHAAAARKLPLTIANARLSPRSFAGYRRLGGFVRDTLACCRHVAAQTAADAQRYRELGAPAERVSVMGNLKFDLDPPAALVERGRALRAAIGARPVWIAASTHAGEEQIALDAHRSVRQRFPDALLILVPRHPQRFDEAAALIDGSRMPWERRSRTPHVSPLTSQVLLGDSMGELAMYLAAADVAFMGGSFAPIGGHNVLEPAALGVPVLFGPQMFNFAEARALLLAAGGAQELPSAAALAPALESLWGDAARREAMGRAAQAVVAANRGALSRLLALLPA